MRRWFLYPSLTQVVALLAIGTLAAAGQSRVERPARSLTPNPIETTRPGMQPRDFLRNLRTTSQISLPSVSYFGGPLVSNAEIVVVFWGSNVDPNTVSGIGGFYEAVLGSSLMNMLSEYNSLGRSPGTNQAIGHGTLKGSYTITPSQADSGTKLNDGDIGRELVLQITNGALPGPTFDAAGIQNTIYMIYFPPGISIVGPSASGTSCVDFCGYHSVTIDPNVYDGRNLRYAVIPDLGGTSACSNLCGNGSTFDNVTTVSTHEMAETITDPVGGYYSQPAPPTGWLDFDYYDGEIADFCDFDEASGASGYTVQLLWSNLQNQCTQAPPQFGLAAPAAVPPGVPFTVTVTAEDYQANRLAGYTGVAMFSSSDGAASLPADYIFFTTANGSANFPATLRTPGPQTITVGDQRVLAMTGTATVNVVPPVAVTVGTAPAGPSFSIDGVTYTTPQVLTWAPGSTHTIAVASPQANGLGELFLFDSWSDGGAATHTVTAPSTAANFTANFDVAVNPQRPTRAPRASQSNSGILRQSNRIVPRGSPRVDRSRLADR